VTTSEAECGAGVLKWQSAERSNRSFAKPSKLNQVTIELRGEARHIYVKSNDIHLEFSANAWNGQAELKMVIHVQRCSASGSSNKKPECGRQEANDRFKERLKSDIGPGIKK
jgi:hypothetical protein